MSSGKKILVVDDDPEVVEVLSRFLTQTMRYQVQAVSNGPAAIAALKADPPDLVMLDITMPGMDGIEVLKHVDRSIAVMIVSGNSDGAPAEALKHGAFAYIPKPFDLTYVEQLVPLAIEQRRPPQAWVSRSGV